MIWVNSIKSRHVKYAAKNGSKLNHDEVIEADTLRHTFMYNSIYLSCTLKSGKEVLIQRKFIL